MCQHMVEQLVGENMKVPKKSVVAITTIIALWVKECFQ